MTWSATKTSAGSGAWNTAGNWSPSGVPGIDDYVEITHSIDVPAHSTSYECAGLYVKTDGSFTIGHATTFSIKDAAGTHTDGSHIRVSNDGTTGPNFISSGTYAEPAIIASKSTVPTNRLRMSIKGLSGYDVRTLTLGFLELRGSAIYLGDGTNALWFNTGNYTTDGLLSMPSKVRREQKFNDHFIPGRNASRINRVGGYAGTLDINGLLPWTGWQEDILEAMRDGTTRLAFLSQFVSMPRCHIEHLRPAEPKGTWLPFAATLVEDI